MLPNSKVKAIGLLAAVAIAGFAGGAATRSLSANPPAAPVDWRERCSYSGMLKDRLNLSEAQRDSIRTIMRNHRPEMHALMETVRPRMDSMRAVVRAQIREVMTPEQRAQYDSLAARDRAERRERGGDSLGRGSR